MSTGRKKKPLQSVKCVIVGDGAAGKTCLLTKYHLGEFPKDYCPTVFDTFSSEITINNKKCELTLWDTTGQEHYERLRPLSYGNADVFIICYDVARPSSYQNISSLWISEVNHYCPGIPVILVACKTDLRQSSENQIVSETATSETDETDDKTVSSKAIKFITTAEGEQLAKDIKASGFVECSAKSNENVSTVFITAAEEVLNRKSEKCFNQYCKIF